MPTAPMKWVFPVCRPGSRVLASTRRCLVRALVCSAITVLLLASCSAPTRDDATRYDAVDIGMTADEQDFAVTLWFDNGASTGPTPYSYARCPIDGGKVCPGDPENWHAGDYFSYLQTAQFVVDAAAKPVALTVGYNAGKDRGFTCLAAYHKDEFDRAKDYFAADGTTRHGIVFDHAAPVQLTLIPAMPGPDGCTDRGRGIGKLDGTRALAVWLSPRWWSGANPPQVDPPPGAIVCRLAADVLDAGDYRDGPCHLSRPRWRLGDNNTVLYTGTLWEMLDDNTSDTIFIHVDEKATLDGTPLNNQYVEYAITSGQGDGCARAVDALNAGKLPDAGLCSVRLVGSFAKPTEKRFIVTGFGRLSGWPLFARYRDQPPDPLQIGSTADLSDQSARDRTEYYLESNLLALSTASRADPAIDVSGITVAWGPKRYQSAVNLNTLGLRRVGSSPDQWIDNNRPVKVVDVKMPGNWVDAADGPEVGADRASVAHAYLLIADDAIKIAAQNVTYTDATVLQGNAGGVVNLGSYGYNRGITGSRVTGVYVHRITHHFVNPPGRPDFWWAQDDDRGAIVTSRTCPLKPIGSDQPYANLNGARVDGVYVPKLGDDKGLNSVTRPIAIGVQGSGKRSRDGFCKGELATGGFQIGGEQRGNAPLTFAGWRIYPNPQSWSVLYSDPPANVPVNWGRIDFYTGPEPPPGQVDPASAVTMFSGDGIPSNGYFVCAVNVDPALCWTGKGPGGAHNLYYDPAPGDALSYGVVNFPYGQ